LEPQLFRKFQQHWNDLLSILVAKSFSKSNKFMQQNALQAIRMMSDYPEVKKQLCKLYKRKIESIHCLSSHSIELKDDLLHWLDYKSYKPPTSGKYSKLLV